MLIKIMLVEMIGMLQITLAESSIMGGGASGTVGLLLGPVDSCGDRRILVR